MAHQATNIPWRVLASNLKWSQAGGHPPGHPGNGDLQLQFKPQQGKELHYFVEAFTRNVREHAKTARNKYPGTYEPPHPDSIILDDAVARRISPTIRRWRAGEVRVGYHKLRGPLFQPSVEPPHGHPCRHTRDEGCQCPIPCEERKASSFYRKYRQNECYRFFEENGEAFFNQEIVKTLLLYGQMDTVLRVCAIPDVGLKDWWELGQYSDVEFDAGWNQICYRALAPYIALNLVYCFPETWDDASGRTDEKDYRLMRIYQYALRSCTYSGATSEVPSHPHRRFFGIEDGQFKDADRPDLCGRLSFETFLNSDTLTPQKPAPSAVPRVQGQLRRQSLAAEHLLDILEMAGYEPGEGRLKVPHDPFHPENRDELAKYLRYCWELLVRCEMMANAIGMEIPWMEVMYWTLVSLLESDEMPPRKAWHDRDVDEETYHYL